MRIIKYDINDFKRPKAVNLGDKEATHTPLKNVLLEYKDQNDLLLKLLSTVSKAAQKSNFISDFVESANYLVRLNSKTAKFAISINKTCNILKTILYMNIYMCIMFIV